MRNVLTNIGSAYMWYVNLSTSFGSVAPWNKRVDYFLSITKRLLSATYHINNDITVLIIYRNTIYMKKESLKCSRIKTKTIKLNTNINTKPTTHKSHSSVNCHLYKRSSWVFLLFDDNVWLGVLNGKLVDTWVRQLEGMLFLLI